MSRAEELRKFINDQLGTEVVKKGSDSSFEVTYMPTGLLPFDIALGGGMPRGRFIEVTGAYSTLKSYLGLKAIAQVQREGGVAALIDTEHAYDPAWAATCGVKTDELLLWPNLDSDEHHTGEEAIDVAEVMVRNQVDLIVFDSIAATLPQQEGGKRLAKETVQPGRLAALMSLACRKLTAANSKTGILWVNQLREQIGVTFGNPERPSGGRAMGYYASIRMNIRLVGKETRERKAFTGTGYTSSKEVIGQNYKITIEKSKLSKPWREVFFTFTLDEEDGGYVDNVKFVFTQCVELGIVKQKGSTWQTDLINVRGRENFLQHLKDDPALLDDLTDQVLNHHFPPPSAAQDGKSAPAKKKAAGSKRSSSAKGARRLILVQGQGGSKTMGRRRKTS